MAKSPQSARVRQELEVVRAAVAQLPAEELPELLGHLREVEVETMARLMVAPSNGKNVSESDKLLDVEEAALRLAVSEDYLYRHWKTLPFASKQDWGLRFSSKGIDEFIRQTRSRKRL